MQGIFQKENTDKALKYGIYRHLPTYEKIIRNLVSFYIENCILQAEPAAVPVCRETDRAAHRKAGIFHPLPVTKKHLLKYHK